VGAFDLVQPLAEQRVVGSPLGGVLGGFFEVPIPLEVDLAAETMARETGPAQAVRLRSLTLGVTATAEEGDDTDDLSFIDRVDIFVESREGGSSLPRVRVATLGDVAPGTREVSFDTDEEVNLLPYVQEGARLTSEGEGTAPPDDVTFAGEAILTVEVL
jgi:hypothetical protein